jgi:hypothetical protein
MIKVRLIIDSVNRQWIIGKMALRLAEHLGELGFDADVGDSPSEAVQLNHWMLYLQPWRHYYGEPGFFSSAFRPGATRHTAMITHVDDPLKVRILREAMAKILDVGICMSRMTKAELVGYGLDASRLTYVNPAHDGLAKPRRVVVGITSRLYGDARKGEEDLVQVARAMSLSAFRFEIFGKGWQDVAAVLREAGAQVVVSEDEDYARIVERVAAFDYYLYAGWDEGSMGTLDALAAGVKTIVSPQGFHLDLPGGITHPFRDPAELTAVFASIQDDRQRRLDSVRDLTWREYARKHALIWRAVLEDRIAEVPALAGERPADAAPAIGSGDLASARSRLYRRTGKSEFWPFFLQSRRFWVRGKLSVVKRFLLRRTPSR